MPSLLRHQHQRAKDKSKRSNTNNNNYKRSRHRINPKTNNGKQKKIDAASFCTCMLVLVVWIQFFVGFLLMVTNINTNTNSNHDNDILNMFEPPAVRHLSEMLPDRPPKIETTMDAGTTNTTATTTTTTTTHSDYIIEKGLKKMLRHAAEDHGITTFYASKIHNNNNNNKNQPNHQTTAKEDHDKNIKENTNKLDEPNHNDHSQPSSPAKEVKPIISNKSDNKENTNKHINPSTREEGHITASNHNNNNNNNNNNDKKAPRKMKVNIQQTHIKVDRNNNVNNNVNSNTTHDVKYNKESTTIRNATAVIHVTGPPPPPRDVDLQDLAKMSCPGPDFSGPDKKCINIENRTLPEHCGGNMNPNCFENLYDKWIMLVGDSNMRLLYFSTHRFDNFWEKDRSTSQTLFYDGRERFNDTLKIRFSYRFTPWFEQSKGCEYCTSRTELDAVLEDPRIAYEFDGKRPIKQQMVSDDLTYNTTSRKPDVVVMNMGLWEVIGLNDTEWIAHQPKLEVRFRAILKRWQCEYASTPLIWITTPSTRPAIADLKRARTMTRGRMSWLAAMEARIVRNEFPWVHFVDNWSWTDKEDFAGADDYHYGGCSGLVARDLLVQTICSTIEQNEKREDKTREAVC